MRHFAILLTICLIVLLCFGQVILADDGTATATAIDTSSDKTSSADQSAAAAAKKPSPFKRKQISEKKLGQLEKEWEKGDEEAELEMEFDHNRKIAAKLNTVNYNDLDLIRKLAKEDPLKLTAGSGQKMMFAELKKRDDGTKWDKLTVDKMSARWQGLLRTASLTAEFYNIEEEKVLVSVGKTWMLRDVIKFVVQQPEVETVRLDNKDYTINNFEELLEDEDEF
jgi:hypothetical protein